MTCRIEGLGVCGARRRSGCVADQTAKARSPPRAARGRAAEEEGGRRDDESCRQGSRSSAACSAGAPTRPLGGRGRQRNDGPRPQPDQIIRCRREESPLNGPLPSPSLQELRGRHFDVDLPVSRSLMRSVRLAHVGVQVETNRPFVPWDPAPAQNPGSSDWRTLGKRRTSDRRARNIKEHVMKILFVLEDLGFGGVQRHTIDLAQALCPKFKSHFCVLGPMPADASERLGTIPATFLAGRGLQPSTWKRLGREISRVDADIVVSLNQVATLAVAAARLAGANRGMHVVALHSTSITNVAGWIRTAPFVPITRQADALIFVSANQRRYWSGRGLRARRTVVIRNGIRAEQFPPPSPAVRLAARAQAGFEPDDFVIGLTAMFRWEKNHRQLIDAISALRSRGVPAKAMFVGDGPTRREIEARAAEADLADHVRFTGQTKDVRPFLAAMDVGVSCSTAVETLSLAALEAMASGIPMIMSNVGGASEIIKDGECGYLFDPGDTGGLVDRLIKCTNRPLLSELASNARRRACSEFSYDKMVGGYATLFSEINAGIS